MNTMREDRYLDKLWTMAAIAESKGFMNRISERDESAYRHIHRVIALEYNTLVVRWDEDAQA